jgi:Transposase DDE domain
MAASSNLLARAFVGLSLLGPTPTTVLSVASIRGHQHHRQSHPCGCRSDRQSTPDSEAPCAVLRQQQAAGHGKTRAQTDALSQGRTTLVSLIPQAGGADLSRFTPVDFRISDDGLQCTCPNRLTSTRRYQHGDSDGVFFRFTAAQCRDCPLWSDCRDAESKPTAHRTVYLSDYHLYLRDAARFNATDAGKALLKSRWQVEPTIAWLVRYHGCRNSSCTIPTDCRHKRTHCVTCG